MEKYFNLQYWLLLVSLCLVGLFVLIGILRFIVISMVDSYRSNSKKWQYNYVQKRWEKVKENDR